MQTKRQWSGIFKGLKEKSCQARIVYPAKISFKKLSRKTKLREFIDIRLTLQELLQEVL